MQPLTERSNERDHTEVGISRISDVLPTVEAGPAIAPLDRWIRRRAARIVIDRVDGSGRTHDGTGTAWVVALGPTWVGVGDDTFPIPKRGYAVVPVAAEFTGGPALLVVDPGHRGLFVVGGPVEPSGRLRYIDGCTDTVLVSPTVFGDPCLNLLHLPSGVVQTDHVHPSDRVGVVLAGAGRCVLPTGTEQLAPGTVFHLPALSVHRFETPQSDLLLVAWHPDSDFGPTDDDHPMLNRTLWPGTNARVR